MSWDSDRAPQPKKSKDEIISQLRRVNATLEQLSFDTNLTDDFRDPTVSRAIKHWTNENRLPPDKAALLQDNYRVVSVLQKISKLQNCCREAGIPVPLELFLGRKPEMGIDFLSKCVGKEIANIMHKEISLDDTLVRDMPVLKTSTLVSNEGNEVMESDESGILTAEKNVKRVFGPSVESTIVEEYSSDVTTSLHPTSIFRSRIIDINDKKFSSIKFLFFVAAELVIIVSLGFLLAYFLKGMKYRT